MVLRIKQDSRRIARIIWHCLPGHARYAIHPMRWNRVRASPRDRRPAVWAPANQSSGRSLPPVRGSCPDFAVVAFNDLHGRLFRPGPEPAAPVNRLESAAAVVRELARERPTLFVGAGDDHSGSEWDAFWLDPEAIDPAYALYADAGVDAVTLGNHDFDAGIDTLAGKLQRHPHPPVVASNLSSGTPLANLTFPGLILEFASLRIGIIGLLTDDQCLPEVGLIDPLLALGHWSDLLLPLVHGIVVLSHLGHASPARRGEADDAVIVSSAVEASRPYLIVGGHSHRTIPGEEVAFSCITRSPAYIQGGCHGELLSTALFSANDQRFRLANQPWPAAPAAPAGAANPTATGLLQSLDGYRRDFGALDLSPLGPRDPETVDDAYRRETVTLNLLTDLLRDAATSLPALPEDTIPLAALCVRSLGTTLPMDELDHDAFFRMLPYGDRLAWIDLPRDSLEKFLAVNARRLRHPSGFLAHCGFLHFDASLRHTIELHREQVDVRLDRASEILRKTPRPHTIRILSNAYVCFGFGGFDTVFEETGFSLRELPHGLAREPLRDVIATRLRQFLAEDPGHREPIRVLDGRLRIVRH